MAKKKMMYPGAFEELLEALRKMKSSTSTEILGAYARFDATKEPFTPLEMVELNKLEGKRECLATIIGIMVDAMRIYEAEGNTAS